MKVEDLKGKAVVSLAEGARVGTVADVMMEGLEIRSLVVKGDHGQGLLPFDRIHAQGPDAITIDSSSAIAWDNGKRTPHGHDLHALRKLVVVDSHGTVLGHVHDVVLGNDGHLESISVREGGVLGIGGHERVVPRNRIRAVGPKLVTVETGPVEENHQVPPQTQERR